MDHFACQALIEKLQAETDAMRADNERRRAAREAGETDALEARRAGMPKPNWRGKTVGTMSNREFSDWIDAGRPALDNDDRFVTKSEWRKREASFAQALTDRVIAERKRTGAMVEALADEAGATCGRLEKRINELQAEIETLRAARFADETERVVDWQQLRASRKSAA